MPIGDLLASISGAPAASNPAKRKAVDDIKPAPKVARQTPQATRPAAQPSRPLERPNGSSARPPTSLSRPTNGTKDALKPSNGVHRVTKPAASARPAAPQPAAMNGGAAQSRAPPKKGSYAEILARGKKAQQTYSQLGVIQHKKVEKKDKEPATKPEPRAAPKKAAAANTGSGTGYQGTAKPGARPALPGGPPRMRNGASSAPPARDPRGRPVGKPQAQAERKSAAQEEHEKKLRKAAQATTGYTGTARPKPGAPAKKNQPPARGGALLNRPQPRPSQGRSSRYEDEYDEDMDDFIDYDDEEEDDGGRPPLEYASDASSDMEGGFDDLYDEERQAEIIAKREDIEEERMEKKLKAEKEERKRKYLASLKTRGR